MSNAGLSTRGSVNRYGLFVLEGLKAWIDPKREKAKTIHHPSIIEVMANSSSMAT
jgi:hypothetical protein